MSTTMAKTQTLIYRRNTLLEKLGISKTTLCNWMLNEGFPPPIQQGHRAVGWKANNVDEWLESRLTVALAEALNSISMGLQKTKSPVTKAHRAFFVENHHCL